MITIRGTFDSVDRIHSNERDFLFFFFLSTPIIVHPHSFANKAREYSSGSTGQFTHIVFWCVATLEINIIHMYELYEPIHWDTVPTDFREYNVSIENIGIIYENKTIFYDTLYFYTFNFLNPRNTHAKNAQSNVFPIQRINILAKHVIT